MSFLLGLAGPILSFALPIILKMVMNSFLKQETKDKMIQHTLNFYVWYEKKTKIAIRLHDEALNIEWQKVRLKVQLENTRKAAEKAAKKAKESHSVEALKKEAGNTKMVINKQLGEFKTVMEKQVYVQNKERAKK